MKQSIRIRKLNDDLEKTFAWSYTPQGQEYWEKVSDNLLKLAKEQEEREKEVN